jgi:nucleotide-binding universal stress UspA family protein
MKILIAVDGSECSARAVDSLIAHVQWFAGQPELHLLHVHPPVPIGLAAEHLSEEVLQAYYREESGLALEAAEQRLTAAGLPYARHIHVGPVAETIVKVAGELGCELICMGTHGRGAVAGALMGSVAARVLHLSSIPVLLAR